MSQIANFIIKAQRELTILSKLVRIWIFMNAVYRWNCALLQFACDGFVCRQHEFFDQLMRFIVLYTLQSDRLALLIDPHFYLGKIEVQRAVVESFAPQ